MANQIRNLASAIVKSGPGISGTTLVVEGGYGGGMPDVPFFLTATPPGQLSTRGNSEIVLVTALSNDTMTIVRAQKETSAKDISAGWSVSNSVYVELSTHVGDIVTTLNDTPGSGRLFMDGGTYDKSDYPLLYEHVKNNSAYGIVTSTTFTLAICVLECLLVLEIVIHLALPEEKRNIHSPATNYQMVSFILASMVMVTAPFCPRQLQVA